MPSNLSLRLLGDCSQGRINEFTFYAGESKTLKFQVYDLQDDQKVCVPRSITGTTVTKTLYLPSSAGPDITIADANITQDANDDSVFTVALTPTQTNLMMTGWLKFTYLITVVSPASTTLRVAYKEFAIKKLATA